MSLIKDIQSATVQSLNSIFDAEFSNSDFQINQTKPEFTGDYTVVLFALLKKTKLSPEALGQQLGEKMIADHPQLFKDFNVIKGFLNFTIADNYWLKLLNENFENKYFGKGEETNRITMVEYASPNTNKPLHLGHLRNIFLGWSVSEIFKAAGNKVVKTCIVNDRGVHICKSMLAWKMFGNGETPENSGEKGDHLVGKYYVQFENELKKQTLELAEKEKNENYEHYSDVQKSKIIELQQQWNKLAESDDKKASEKQQKISGEINEMRRSATPVMKEVQQMLLDWENGNEEVKKLWATMNGWVYKGFDETYKKIGVGFDKIYYESDTYLLGKNVVQKGLDEGVFYRKEDGSVWIDLTDVGLDEKILLRKDGTSVYITQDLGLAIQKHDEFKMDDNIYVIGDEQNYHVKVLQEIAKKMKLPAADDIFHLSYGMVELPSGKMKSREGTVVDADDIVADMELSAKEKTAELGKVNDFTEDELNQLNHNIGLGALKFFLLRMDPKKRMIFNPEESIDFHGFTGPFIQFNYARIQSILRKNDWNKTITLQSDFLPLEKELIVTLEKYPSVVQQAAQEMNPSLVAIYVYQLAKSFSSFYTEHSIANAESEDKKQLRLRLANFTGLVIKSAMNLLGINVPERM